MCHFASFVMYSPGATFEEHCSNISGDTFLIDCCTVLVEPPMTSSLSSFALYKNVNISKKKKDISKRKSPFFFTLKNLSNKQLTIIFYFMGTLSIRNYFYGI